MSDLDHTYCSRCNTSSYKEIHGADKCADILRKQNDALESALKEANEEIQRLKDALVKIKDYQPIEPPYPTEKMKAHGDDSDCKECAEYKNHPVSHGICSAGYRIIYGWENACKEARNYRWIEMSNIAKDALKGCSK
jgi:hypothetical protein